MERDAPELPGIVAVMSGATRAMQRAVNLQLLISLSHLSTMVQTGTKVKTLQHCLVRL